jgi:hypothetical protein
MPSTVVVAVIGLITTAAASLGSAWLQGRISARNAEQTRLHELRVTAFIAASSYIEAVGANLDHLTCPVEIRSRHRPSEVPSAELTGAQLRLLAPEAVISSWRRLVADWNWLFMYTINNGPQTRHGDYVIDAGDPRVRGVEESLAAVTTAMRAAIDSEGIAAPIQERLHCRKVPEAGSASAEQ